VRTSPGVRVQSEGVSSSTLVAVGPGLAVAVVVLALLAAAVSRLGGLGHERQVLVAALRAVVQLTAVALVIGVLLRSFWLSLIFVAVMAAAATRTAGRRLTRGPGWWWAAVPLLAGAAPVVLALLLSGLLPRTGLAVIPVSGILLGGAMTATSLAGRTALDELRSRRGELEAALSVGLLDRDAALLVCRDAAARALVPALDQTRTVGLVTLPGAFVGLLLAGASPVSAGAVQVFVLVALLAVEAVAVVVVTEMVARGRWR
jgi:putative ABC transport system permease protein